jgi:hypothetical protein
MDVHPAFWAYAIFILLDEENRNLRGGVGGDAQKARAINKAIIKATTPERRNMINGGSN